MKNPIKELEEILNSHLMRTNTAWQRERDTIKIPTRKLLDIINRAKADQQTSALIKFARTMANNLDSLQVGKPREYTLALNRIMARRER